MDTKAVQPHYTFPQLLRGDLKVGIGSPSRNRLKCILIYLMKLVLYPRYQVVLLFRLSQLFISCRLGFFAYLIQAYILVISGAEIHPRAKIGPGFMIVHSSGIVIGDHAVIGRLFHCYQGVTVGDSGKGGGQPVIGDNFTAYAGCKVLGEITVGDNAIAGANAVVMIDIPTNGVAAGIPAKIVKIRSQA